MIRLMKLNKAAARRRLEGLAAAAQTSVSKVQQALQKQVDLIKSVALSVRLENLPRWQPKYYRY